MASIDLNSIRISDFPQTNDILSSDTLILFDSSSFSPIVCKVADLSAYAILKGHEDYTALKEKVDMIADMASKVKMYLDKTFITKADASTTYATKTELEAQLNKLETIKDFTSLLANKASNEDLEEAYQYIKNGINQAKFLLGGSAWGGAGSEGRGYKRIAASKAAYKKEEA